MLLRLPLGNRSFDSYIMIVYSANGSRGKHNASKDQSKQSAGSFWLMLLFILFVTFEYMLLLVDWVTDLSTAICR